MLANLRTAAIVVVLGLWRIWDQLRWILLFIALLGVLVFWPRGLAALAALVLVWMAVDWLNCLINGTPCDNCGTRIHRVQFGTPCPHNGWER